MDKLSAGKSSPSGTIVSPAHEGKERPSQEELCVDDASAVLQQGIGSGSYIEELPFECWWVPFEEAHAATYISPACVTRGLLDDVV
jgi:hypothetical protein